MAEPTSAYSCYDLVLRVAETAAVAYYGASGDGRAMIPIDEFTLDKCLRVVNDAIKMFIGDAPPTGWRWMSRIAEVTFATVQTEGTVDSGSSTTLVDDALGNTYDEDNEIVDYYAYDLTQEIYAKITAYAAATGTVTVSEWLDYNDNPSNLTPTSGDSYSITDRKTVAGDKARYYLPQDFNGRVTGKITYQKESNRGHLIEWVSEAQIRTNREVNVITGYPTTAAVRPFAYRRWELIVDPSPSAADTVIFPYELAFDKLQLVSGDASGGSAITLVDDDLADLYPDDYFNGWMIHIIDGTGRNARAKVTDYTGSSGTFTVADWLAADGSTSASQDPAANSIYYVEPINNRQPAGQQFDQVILAACLAQTEMQFDDVQTGYVQKYYNSDLPRAHAIDARSAPRKLGRMQLGGRLPYERIWEDVTYNTS